MFHFLNNNNTIFLKNQLGIQTIFNTITEMFVTLYLTFIYLKKHFDAIITLDIVFLTTKYYSY